MDQLIHRYSTWKRLKTTVAWILRAQRLFRPRRTSSADSQPEHSRGPNPLSAGELELASAEIIRYVQHSHGPADSVRKLDPVMDEAGLLRVGGRLTHSTLPVDIKHPIILPRDSQVSRLILTSAHQKVGHLGTNSTFTELRRTYWISRASQLVRSIIAKYVLCRRYRGHL